MNSNSRSSKKSKKGKKNKSIRRCKRTTKKEIWTNSREEITAGTEETKSTLDAIPKRECGSAKSFAPIVSNAPSKLDTKEKMAKMAAKKAQVKPFVEGTLKKGVMGLIAEFRKLKRLNDLTKMVEFVQQNPQGRNRYKDVGCLDNSRVILSTASQPYIHANYVSTPTNQKRFICTQAPLPKTCGDFWHMIVQEKSTVIIMLCNFIEKGAKKCAEYYPTNKGPPMEFDGEIVVNFIKQDPKFQQTFLLETKVNIVATELEVIIRGGPPHICTHYHWLYWPDRGVPEADLAPISLLGKLKGTKTPMIVHCSAGIGRTGSIVLIQHAMELIFSGQPLLEIRVYMENLRLQRNNSVQTEHQYLYVHQVLLIYLRRSRFIDSSYNAELEKFSKEYIKATSGF